MSTTDTAVAESGSNRRSFDERATALGPGVIRTPDGGYLCPASSTIGVRCQGPLAHFKVINQFQVPADCTGDEEWLFLFPMPSEGSLLSLDIQGANLMPDKLAVKAIADLPESAVRPTPPESLVTQFGAEISPVMSLRLSSWAGQLQPGGQFQIELEYAGGLPTVDGRICLSLPTSCSPEIAGDSSTSFQFAVAIEDGNELVDEPTSEPSLESVNDGDALVLTGAHPKLDDDLLITFRPGRTQMPVTRLRRSEEHFIFSIFPPTSIPASPQRRDLVFAVDASENLDAESFELVKADLCRILRDLDENDRFALVTFGREIDGYDGGEFCDIEQVEAACKWLEASRPLGRANVQPLLERVQSLPAQEDRQLCVFLLAAGHVGNEPSILKSLDFDQSDRRYYTVGIGPTVKQSFLRRLALLTRGRCEVATVRGCAEALERLLGQTRALLAEVTFEDQDATEVALDSLVPSKMTSLTPQGPVHCLGCGAPSSLRFRSKDETGVFFAGTVNAQPTDNPALSGVWAGLRVRELLDSIKLTTGAKRKSLKAEASSLAAKHGILTSDTLLVMETADGIEIQYGSQPSGWSKEKPKEKKGNVSNKDGAAPFDWRKGLVAREGLFKGSKLASGSDSGESSGRYGLRSKVGSSSESSGKPRLDRAVTANSSAKEEELPLEDESAAEDIADGPGLTADVAPTSVPVVVASGHSPVVHLHSNPLSEGRIRLESFREQLHSYDVEMALASLAGLPGELSPKGGELPRILAQTVAHLEKRGFYSHAVSVLGLLLRDNPSPEVEKKMEALLSGWAESVVEEKLPEAIQILKLGQRVCSSSRGLEAQCQEYLAKWGEVSQSQVELPAVKTFAESSESELSSLLSEPQIELARLKQEQADLSGKMQSLQTTVQEQLAALPGLLEKVAEQTAAAVVAKLPVMNGASNSTTPVQSEPTPAASDPPEPVQALQPELQTQSDVASSTVTDQTDTDDAITEIILPDPEPLSQEKAPETVEITAAIPSPQPAPASDELAKPAEVAPLPEEPVEPAPAPVEPTAVVEPVAEAEPVVTAESQPQPEESSEAPEVVQTEPTPVEMDEPEATSVEPEPEAVTAEVQPDDTPPEIEEVMVAPTKPPEPEPVMLEEEEVEPTPLSREELTELLTNNPRNEANHKAVAVSLTEPKERINFFRDLVKANKSEAYHSLSLARAYRSADQTKVAVVHYQKYLRSDKDPQAYLELADAYDELGKANLSASARKAAEAYR